MIIDMSRVATGQIVAQTINFLALPILTRLYDPEVFGVFAIFSSVAWVLVIFGTLQIEHLIITMKTKELAKAMAFSITLILFFFVCVSVLFVYWATIFFEPSRIIAEIHIYLYWVAVTVFLLGLNQVFRFYATSIGEFRCHGSSVVFNSIGLVSVSVGCALLVEKENLVFGLILGQISGLFLSLIPFLLATDILKFREVKLFWFMSRILSAQSSKIPVLLLTHLSKTMNFRLPVFIVAAVGGGSSAGAFAMADRLISIPTGVLGQSIGQVFRYRYKSDKNHSVREIEQPRRVIKLSTIIAIPSYGALIFYGDSLILFLLGEEWKIILPFIQLVAIMEMMNFIYYGVEDVAIIRGIYYYRMLWQFAQLCLLAILFLVTSTSGFISEATTIVLFVCAIRVFFVLYDLYRTWTNRADVNIKFLKRIARGI